MTPERVSETAGCNCPEVHLTDDERARAARFGGEVPEWVAVCEHTHSLEELPSDSSSPEPINWRCPSCKGGIMRTGMRKATEEEAGTEPFLYWRADFRCCSPICGWGDWIILITQ